MNISQAPKSHCVANIALSWRVGNPLLQLTLASPLILLTCEKMKTEALGFVPTERRKSTFSESRFVLTSLESFLLAAPQPPKLGEHRLKISELFHAADPVYKLMLISSLVSILGGDLDYFFTNPVTLL